MQVDASSANKETEDIPDWRDRNPDPLILQELEQEELDQWALNQVIVVSEFGDPDQLNWENQARLAELRSHAENSCTIPATGTTTGSLPRTTRGNNRDGGYQIRRHAAGTQTTPTLETQPAFVHTGTMSDNKILGTWVGCFCR